MNKEEILQYANQTIDEARHIQVLLGSQGWAIYKTIRDKKIAELSDLKHITSLKELEAIKKAIKLVDGIDNELKGRIDQSDEALKIIKKFKS